MQNRIDSLRWLAILWLAMAVVIAPAQSARAAEVTASASLSHEETTVGEGVELTITVNGSRQSGEPPEIRVEGLNIQYYGPQTRIEMHNFEVTQSVAHTYLVTPERSGTFTIPALQIEAGGKKLSTRPLKLTVGGGATGGNAGSTGTAGSTSPGSGSPGSPDGGSSGDRRTFFAEWSLPKRTAYVGEMIPAELRLYVASNVQFGMQRLPTVKADGFTFLPLPHEPKQARVTRDGQIYNVVIFKTALTAVKPGQVTIEPTDIPFLAKVQRRRPPVPRGFRDAFDDPFFNDVFNTVTQELTASTEAIPMEIKPLPAAGRPKHFSEAVGNFTLEVKASPLKAKVGDPVTVTATVSGMGSFDRMEAPAVDTGGGWRAYPPSAKFKAGDDFAMAGAKTFEFAMIPDRPQTGLPKIEFSYFDPVKEQYVTLNADPVPLVVEGSAAPAPTATPSQAVAGTTSASPKPQGTGEGAGDILFIRTDAGSWNSWAASFEPAWRARGFWLGQLAPFTALLIGLGWRWRAERLGNADHRRVSELRQEKAAAVRQMREAAVSSERFYTAAVRAFRLETALGTSAANPESLDAEAVCSSRKLDDETAREIRQVFAAHDELQYAGAHASSEAVSPDRRERILKTLAQFEKSHA